MQQAIAASSAGAGADHEAVLHGFIADYTEVSRPRDAIFESFHADISAFRL